MNPLVDALFDEIENLRRQLFESDLYCHILEADVREEVTREMQLEMEKIERLYSRRLISEVWYHME